MELKEFYIEAIMKLLPCADLEVLRFVYYFLR